MTYDPRAPFGHLSDDWGRSPPPPPPPPPPPKSTRSRGRLIGAAIGAVVLAVVIGVAVAGSGDEGETTVGSRPTERDTGEPTTERPTTTEPPTTTTTLPPPAPLDGSGPSVVDIQKDPDSALVARITANAAGRYCGITNFDAAGQEIDLLVNTTEPYEGVRPIDLNVGEQTTRFQIECEGAWHIDFAPLESVPALDVGETRSHPGDDVFIVYGADTLTISGNSGARYMGIDAYDIETGEAELLVNTTDPYQGEVISPTDALLVVEAVGDWSVTNNGRP